MKTKIVSFFIKNIYSSITRTTTNKYCPELDFLRFFALIPVIFYHLFTSLKRNSNFDLKALGYEFYDQWGDLGVKIFYVLSSFILTSNINNLRIKKVFSYQCYLRRRIWRITPPYIICLSILLAFHIFILNEYPNNLLFKSYCSSVFYIHNFVFSHWSYILPVSHTLEIEMHLYLILPIFLTYWCKIHFFVKACVLVTIIYFSKYISLFAFYDLADYSCYFLWGVIISEHQDFAKSQTFSLFSKFGFIICFFLLFVWNIGGITRIATICSFVFLGLRLNININNVLINICTRIGVMCYSLYLVHYPILHLLTKYIFINLEGVNVILVGVISIAIFMATIVLTIPFFVLIEKPFATTFINNQDVRTR